MRPSKAKNKKKRTAIVRGASSCEEVVKGGRAREMVFIRVEVRERRYEGLCRGEPWFEENAGSGWSFGVVIVGVELASRLGSVIACEGVVKRFGVVRWEGR
jgi:hypothetical protein